MLPPLAYPLDAEPAPLRVIGRLPIGRDAALRPVDRVYRWIWTGSDRSFDRADIQLLTVVTGEP